MPDFADPFERAVSHVMRYEVGAWFNPNDKETIAGLISTQEQRRKVGYVNNPNDSGGETKFGEAKSGNPTVDITNLTWATAKQIYKDQYWFKGGCDLLVPRVAILHFDGCVNHGVARAGNFLQEVVGAAQDGKVGPATAARAKLMNEFDVCRLLLDRREKFYRAIVAAKPNQQEFLRGWLSRVNDLRDYMRGPLS
jgi:lysozyme family protein